ncbi:hypothetical protein EYF80_048146 [Liparis tanakae]|uniref:Uncharacterized protein n=1 Tax=Liparis tanakae TaxID=230148 RepID=A0A4Z2FN10_9TELE|nr:hypothetical protein EYF80_048146 [Liparis tanakae]
MTSPPLADTSAARQGDKAPRWPPSKTPPPPPPPPPPPSTPLGGGAAVHEGGVLQHGALAGALSAHHGDLRQLEAAALARAAQRVLEPVDQRDELLHAAVPHHPAGRERPGPGGGEEGEGGGSLNSGVSVRVR